MAALVDVPGSNPEVGSEESSDQITPGPLDCPNVYGPPSGKRTWSRRTPLTDRTLACRAQAAEKCHSGRDQYASLTANHLGPSFGDLELARISAGQGRAWYALRSARTPGASAYRLLRAIVNTAVADELVGDNPCRIRGAGADG